MKLYRDQRVDDPFCDIGQGQNKNRKIGKKIGSGNPPSGYLGNYKASVISAQEAPWRTTRPQPIPIKQPPPGLKWAKGTSARLGGAEKKLP